MYSSQSVSKAPQPVTKLMGCFSLCIGEIDHDIYIYITQVLYTKAEHTAVHTYIIRNSCIHTVLHLSISVAAQFVLISTEKSN